ncbi:GbsR/MarR family transcriptional regulator [Aquibacillus kalidii]|uniref:GbsR/MarR family transcriptional regulator n=1 Tax=Aquibacillus kalidii TaxID=2762597 RepID=UPI0016481C42|nr:transcriptional regulator [Aquibacillus kalidii]
MSKDQLENINNLLIVEFAKTVEMFAISPSEARLFAILYLEGKPMTLDEMSESIGKSKTSVSTGIRTLVDLHLVERVWKKGVRKDLYKADENLYRKFMTSYINKWINETTRQKHSLQEIEKLLMEESKYYKKTEEKNKEINILSERIEELITFHQKIENAFREINPKKNKKMD